MIDFDQVRERALDTRPQLIIVGASAYSRVIDFARFRGIADEVGAVLMADMAHIAGLVAAGIHPSPVGHAQVITFTTHKTMRGPRGGMILCDPEFAERIDRAVFPGTQGVPLMHAVAAKAVALKEASTEQFQQYQRQVVSNARALAGELAQQGFRLVAGGTDNHLVLVDLTPQGMTGRKAELLLDEVGIVVNREPIPFDSRKPWVTSGIRLGSPALTTRGMGVEEMCEVARLISETLRAKGNENTVRTVKERVAELSVEFTVPGCHQAMAANGAAGACPLGVEKRERRKEVS